MLIIDFLKSFMFNVIYWPLFFITLILFLPFAIIVDYQKVRKIIFFLVAKELNFLLRLFIGVKYKIIGLDNLNSQCIIGSNHQSTWETIVLPQVLSKFLNLSVVIKYELLHILFVGFYLKKMKYIAIKRDKPIGAIKKLLTSGFERKQSGDSILIFVNGTRSAVDDKETQHKVGIYAMYKNLNLPVVPCCLNSGECWGKKSFIKKKCEIVVEFKPQIPIGLSREEFDKEFFKSLNEKQKD